ncbi:hypothetical protein E1293_31340 [Actinomadura darangshiensis]|uniref:Uncharacterized protein n=1 Tax=Actinomadura darangshiensis TaxID=705336 RepID=A0A4R5AP68_9ACTN|nr:hypothetical protein [Actinomadura darangshiensis]TDD73449.1 hypothetical protein E1293_31340 [Actinomadura darangshiensis]
MRKVAIVAGGGQGIDPALVRGLGRILAADPGGGVVHRLPDVRQGAEELAAAVAARHGGVDIVVSDTSARVLPGVRHRDQVRRLVEVNNHGTRRVIQGFVPLLNDGARFVVVADRFGALRHLPGHLRPRFDVDRMSLDDLAEVMDGYVDAVESCRAAADGWPGWINVPSRIGQVAAVKILGRELADTARCRDILINVAAGAGAADALWLAGLPAGTRAPYAELVHDRKVIPFGS